MLAMDVILLSLMLILAVSRLKPARAQEQEPWCTSGFGCEYQVLLRLSELETRLREQEKTLEALKTNLSQRNEVALSAYLTSDLTWLENYKTIVFDFVLTNIGGAYNKKTGVFKCRQAGIYVFQWVITNKSSETITSQLVINNEETCEVVSGVTTTSRYNAVSISATNMVVVELNDGDTIWIRSGTWQNGVIDGQKRSSFSGWLLYSNLAK